MIQLVQVQYILVLPMPQDTLRTMFAPTFPLQHTVPLTLVYSKKTNQRCEAEANPNKFRTGIFTSAKYWPNSSISSQQQQKEAKSAFANDLTRCILKN